jgi:hypothetical protein
MNRTRWLWLVVALPLFAAPDSCAPAQAVGGYCLERARLLCGLQYQCCNAAERNAESFAILNLASGGHTTEEECVERVTPLVCQAHGPLEEADATGRGVWDEENAADCLDALDRAVKQCDAEDYFAADLGVCDPSVLMEGQQKTGDLCFAHAECAGTRASCVTRKSSDPSESLTTAEGECVNLPGVGDPCTDGACAAGHYCSFDDVCERLDGVEPVYDLCLGEDA